jgi:hypothetical protein
MLARSIVRRSKSAIEKLQYTRAKAYAMCGLYEILSTEVDTDEFESVFDSRRHSDDVKYVDTFGDKRIFENIFIDIANSLVDLYEIKHKEDWHWFESTVTYSNAKLSEALLLAYDYTKDRMYRKIGLVTLDFLTEIQWKNDYFDIVGNHGWYSYHGKKPLFDQQPIEVGYLTQAYILAYKVTQEKKYLEFARYAFEYFFGRNRLRAIMYDYSTGAVYDGLSIEGMSLNQGAEPIVCYLMALGAIDKYESCMQLARGKSKVVDEITAQQV